MNKKFVVFVVIIAAMAALFIASPNNANAKTVVLRLVVPSPAGDWPLTVMCDDLAKRFNARAKGEYKMEVHAGGALAKLPEYFDNLRVGSIEMALAPWGFYSFMEPRLSLIETPFLLNNQQAGAYSTKALLPLYDQILQEKFNQKGLGLMSLAGVELVTQKPVKVLKDWKGLLLGSLSPSTTALAKELGAAPATINWMEFYDSLQKKVIVGVVNGTHGSLQTNLMDVCKYVTLYYGINSWNGYGINLDVWKKMPKHIQKILQEEVNSSVEWMHKTMLKLDADDLKRMKEKKVTVYTVPPAERALWVKTLTPYIEKQFAGFGDFGKKVRKIADDANKRYPYTGLTLK